MERPIKRLVATALFMALCCVATIVIQVPSPTQGYVNLGDCMVLLSAWLLGPWYGMAAAGVGSAMADVLLSYPHYAPGTLVIKGAMALIAGLLAWRRGKRRGRLLGGLLAEIVMVAGYFGFSCLILGKGLAAAASIPGNIFQGIVGLAAAAALYEALDRSHILQRVRIGRDA